MATATSKDRVVKRSRSVGTAGGAPRADGSSSGPREGEGSSIALGTVLAVSEPAGVPGGDGQDGEPALPASVVRGISLGTTRPSTEPGTRLVDLDWRSVLVVLAGFIGLVAITGLLRSAPHTLTSLAIGGLIALALNPLVGRVQRLLGGHRGVAVLLVLVVLAAVVVGLVALLAPPAVKQAQKLPDQVPRVVRQLSDLPVIGSHIDRGNTTQKIQKWIEDLPTRLQGDSSPLLQAGRFVFDGFLAAFLVFLVAVGLLLDSAHLAELGRRLTPPVHRSQMTRIADLAYRVVGKYIAGSIFMAVIAGVGVLVVGLLLSVPLTPLLALWVALFDLVPQIGGAVGGIPFVALGFSHSAGTGVLCAVFFVLYLQFENHILQPLIIGHAVQLSPPATMTAALVGVSAGGVVGALLAVPLVGAAKAVYMEFRAPSLAAPDDPT
jgi:predicted PurR-regulated permease PerM